MMGTRGKQADVGRTSRLRIGDAAGVLCLLLCGLPVRAEVTERESRAVRQFEQSIRPLLERTCYACHGEGASEGGVTLDEFADDEALLNSDLWLRVLRNVRAGIMPPPGEDRLPAADLALLEDWIRYQAFGIDPDDPDPGHTVLRRLNRREYGYTIRDLLGYDYQTGQLFPPDDTGHGFDNLGSVLSTSPLLVEKYLRAASEIVRAVVPAAARVPRERIIAAAAFLGDEEGEDRGEEQATDRVSCEQPGRYATTIPIDEPGDYVVRVQFEVFGHTFYTTETAQIRFFCDGEQLHSAAYSWQTEERTVPIAFHVERRWQPGEKELAFEVEPHTGDGEKPKRVPLTLRIIDVRVEGPLDEAHWVAPPGYERFFPQSEPPETQAERREYAGDVLRPFVSRAFRRPVDEPTLMRLVDVAEAAYSVPGTTFEQGIQQAMIAALCSRRFLFRFEQPAAESGDTRFPLVDEYSLASRLSYLLWSSMPDDELIELARRGELRSNLASQVQRMLDDPRSSRFVESFVGQWLRTQEIDSVEIDTRLVLARDAGLEAEELAFRDSLLQRFLEQRRKEERQFLQRERSGEDDPADPDKPSRPEKQAEPDDAENVPSETVKPPQLPAVNLDDSLRSAMRAETEACFSYVLRENRSLLELIDSDYTFLNERLARHYGIEGVTGPEMRKAALPEDSPRGGILTHGGILMLTSQSTRTSAVKRGVFVLDNLLGTPPPPAPPNLPALEEAKESIADTDPTLREMLEWHRRDPLCASCHRRMDPIGLALENFNALGLWRTEEQGQPIDVTGELITGEVLTGVADLQKVLVGPRRTDYYRCITEKLMMYALGRGLEYSDVHTVDQIVERLESDGGRAFSLLMGVIESPQFQKCRASDFE